MSSAPQILYDLIDRLIDSQISNTAMLTSLLIIVRENQLELKDINSHFTNGFRHELKEHITEENDAAKKTLESLAEIVENLQDSLKWQHEAINEQINSIINRNNEEIERTKRVDKAIISMKRGATYLKWIVAVIVAIGTVVGGIATVVESWPWEQPSKKSLQNSPSNP